MKARFVMLALAACALLRTAAAGQVPMIGIEPIAATLTATPPTNVFERFYPNVFDLEHPKRLTFQGAISNADANLSAFVDLWFDWIDPRDPVGTPPHTSPVIPIDLAPLTSVPFGLPGGPPAITFMIPFCPPQVSIHIQNNGPGAPVVIEGQFIHECIPEPSTFALAGLAGLGLAVTGRRRRARAL
jgi:MYXO-CTERM domain-containing protein